MPRSALSLVLPLVVTTLLCAVPAADALTVDGGSLVVDVTKSDTLKLKGRLGDVDLGNADAVAVTIGNLAFRIPQKDFVRKRTTLDHRGIDSPEDLRQLKIDLKRRTFTLTAKGWTALGLTTPFRVAIGTDTSENCQIVRPRRTGTIRAPKPGKKPRPVRYKIPKTIAGDDACGGIGTPRTAPGAMTTGVATTITVSVAITATDVDPASARVLRLDPYGTPIATPLCTLAVAAGSDDFTCSFAITEPAPTTIPLLVEARAGGARLTSPGFSLPVIAPHTGSHADLVNGASDALTNAWNDARARLGDTLSARFATIRAARTIPGILSTDISPDGIDITVRFTDGHRGVLILNRLAANEPPAASGSLAATRSSPVAAIPAPGRALPRGIFRSCGDGAGPDAVCCVPHTRVPLLERKVLIWDTGFFKPEFDDATSIRKAFSDHACLGHVVDEVPKEQTDIESISKFTQYGTLIISAHGVVDDQSRVAIGTTEEYTDASQAKHQKADDDNLLVIGLDPDTGKRYWAVTEDYIRQRVPGSFPPHAIVYGSYCYSSFRSNADTFRAKGAGAVYGYDWSVSAVYTSTQVAPQLAAGLVDRLATTDDAYQNVTPKADPYPQRGTVPLTVSLWVGYRKAARFTLSGDKKVAYVAEPNVSPEKASLTPGEQVTLTSQLDGEGSCQLTRHWKNTANYGHLSGGNPLDDFEGPVSAATYTANSDDGADAIGLEVLAFDGSSLVGSSCSDAKVVTRATLDVDVRGLGTGSPWKIEERFPPGPSPRISCPGACSYEADGPILDVGQLLVKPALDARNGMAPWVVQSFDGCTGTSSLPSFGPLCSVPDHGHSQITVNVEYAPMVSIKFAGTTAEFGNGYVQGSSSGGAGGFGFSCYALGSTDGECTAHYSVGTRVRLRTTSDLNPPANSTIARKLTSWDGPCAGQGIGQEENICEFDLTGDTCITMTFEKPANVQGPPRDITAHPCAVGPGDG